MVLAKTILGTHVQLGSHHRLTVGQVLDHLGTAGPTNREEWLEVLAGNGIRLDGGVRSRICFLFQQVSAKLLRGTRWEGQEISQYLRRIDGAEPTRQRVGNINGRCVRFDLERFCEMFSGEEESGIPYGESF